MKYHTNIIKRRVCTLGSLREAGNLQDFEYVSHVIDLAVEYGVKPVFDRVPTWGMDCLTEWYQHVSHTRSSEDVNPLSDSLWNEITSYMSETTKEGATHY